MSDLIRRRAEVELLDELADAEEQRDDERREELDRIKAVYEKLNALVFFPDSGRADALYNAKSNGQPRPDGSEFLAEYLRGLKDFFSAMRDANAAMPWDIVCEPQRRAHLSPKEQSRYDRRLVLARDILHRASSGNLQIEELGKPYGINFSCVLSPLVGVLWRVVERLYQPTLPRAEESGDLAGQAAAPLAEPGAEESVEPITTQARIAVASATNTSDPIPPIEGAESDEAGTGTGELPFELHPTQRAILETMLRHGICSRNRRKNQAQILGLLNRNFSGKVSSYGRYFSPLVKRGFLESQEGPGGGTWINPKRIDDVKRTIKDDGDCTS